MAKKIVKKRKLKVLNLFIVLLVIGALSFFGVFIFKLPIKNIIIKGNNYLNDDYIIELANIKDYPSFLATTNKYIKDRLKKSSYIESVSIERKFFNVLVISIKENRPLFTNNVNKTVVFENKKEVKNENVISVFRIPRLINYVPDNKYNNFIKGMKNINNDVLGKISDIEYQPNEYDKDRFLLYMDDGNMVYLTLTKFKAINYYNDVLSQLENKKGILYLDSGNHFQVKE